MTQIMLTINPLDFCKGCSQSYEDCQDCQLWPERKAFEKSLKEEMQERTIEGFLGEEA